MSKKLILFLMVLLFGSTSFLRADEVTIGDPTSTNTNSFLPTYSLYEYSFSQQIYTADEIGMSGTINDVTLWLMNTSSYARNFNIYMKETSEVTFADGTAWVSMTDADLVATGTLANGISAPVATTFTLSAPFSYSGTGNLVICFQDVTGSWSSGAASVVMTVNGYQALYAYRDGTAYDPTTPGVTGTPLDSKSVVKLNITPGGSGGGGEAGELTVHDGEQTNANVPVYGFYADAYLKCEMVYPAAELAVMENATINGMTFYASEASVSWGAANFQVFVSEVESATISDFAGPGTVVYEGGLSIADNVMTVTFDTPYEYHGGNLLVGFYNTVIGTYVSCSWNGETVSGSSVQGYSYSALSAVTALQRNFLPKTTFYYESGSGPVPPTEGVSITPNPVALAYRPTNGWMEPMTMRIHNGLENAVTMTGNMSNTAGVNAFVMSEEIDNVVLEAENDFVVEIDINRNAAAGDYAEQFTLFYVENSRDIAVVPVTATFYEAGEADIVETAKTINPASFDETPENLHANYFGYEQHTALDAVYQFTLAKDSRFSVSGGTFIGIYNKVLDFHPTMAVEPVAMTYNGTLTDEILVAGDYYMIVAGDNITTISGYATEMPAPTAITNIAPANFATGIEGDSVELTWEGGENAAEYQVLFGTSPTNTPVALDWTVVDENYGSFEATGLVANTQYFWQIKVRNSNGSVTGPRWGFTTALTAPKNVTASAEEIFTDESTLIKWKHSSGTGGFTGEITVADGTETSSYVPVYGLWMDDYTRSEMIYPASMLEEMEGGEITSIKYYISTASSGSWAPATFNVYMMEVDATTLSTYYGSTNATVVYSGALDGTGTEMTITLDTPYEYEGGNLLVGIEQPVVGTYHSCYFYGVTSNGSSASGYSGTSLPAVTFNQRDFLPKTTFVCGGAKGNTANRAFIGYNVYYGDVKANDALLTEKQFLLENLPYNMTGHDINVTAVYDEGESSHSTPIVTVKVSGYATLEGTVTTLATEQGGNEPLAGATVTFYGKDEFNNDVNFETTTDDNGYYSVTVKAGIYNRGVATYAGMEPASMAEESVTVAYEGTETVNFIIHEEYKPVLSVYAEEIDPSMSKVTWSLNTAISGGGSGGSASTFTEGFEGGMPEGWTVIDANNDGTTWTMTSDIPSVWTYYASLTLDWYRTGTNAICSGSYVNGVGALNPDEYLVMGQQNIANGSTLSFWAAATDASYPADHFGVAVSDDATTWTMVQEWTLTGKKGANGGRESRDGNGAKLGTWYNYTVDLSAYAGQKYIAIRHFNCYDQYIMCVDDIELAAASKDRSLDHYAVYRKAILKENEIVPADSVMLVDGYTDTLYADFDWNNVEPGLYQYGVQAVYPTPIEAKGGNRDEIVIGDGTSTTYVTPFNSLWGYSYVEQIYTADEIGMAGTINSIAFNMQSTDAATHDIEIFMVNTDKETFASTSDYVAVTAGDKVFDGSVTFEPAAWTTITLNTPFYYDGTSNLMIGVHEYTSGYSTRYFYYTTATDKVVTFHSDSANPDPCNLVSYGGSSYVSPNRANITIDIVPGGGGGGNDNPVTPITWSNILPKDMETTVTVNALVAAGTAEGATVIMTNTFEDIVFAGEFDETGTLVFPEFHKGNYVVTVDLEGYTSDYAEREVSIWDETTINATLTEIFKPVDVLTVSCTGYATWTPVVPVDRLPEKYFIQLDGVYYGETTENNLQFEGLEEGETYTAGVAVVYSTGMSAYVTTNFTYTGCEGVATQVEELAVDTASCVDMNVVLVWNGGQPTPPTPPTGDVTIVLQADDVWGDGSGYQMLLDDTHSLYGTTIPETGALSLNCTGNDAIYAQFSHKIPTNADGNCSTSNMVNNSSVSITIPAGTYDWCITNPTPGDRIWIASSGGTIGGRYDDYTFEAGYTYTFHVYFGGANDATDLTITGGKGMYQPNMGIMSNDVKTTNFVANNNVMNAGEGFGAAANQMTRDWYYYDNGVNEDAIGTGGGNFWWSIMLPAGSYEGTSLTKVATYDYMAMTGTASIYQGGTSAPAGSALGSVNVTLTGSNDFREFEFAEPITLDPSQNVWVVFYNGSGATYPAAVCANTGDANGRWVSLDGATWEDMATYDLNYTFMIRAFIEAGGPAPVTPTGSITPNAFNIAVDDIDNIVGAVTANTAVITAEDYEEHTYYVFYVDAQYGMSCPASVVYAVQPESVEENAIINAIYPNPTSGDLHINATAMKHISIINTMGQVVYNQDVNTDETVINMAKFESGVYMVNIITENGTSVKRITVTK